MSMDSTNTYRFGQMELALPQNWDVAFFKNTVGNKGLTFSYSCRNEHFQNILSACLATLQNLRNKKE